jgi:Xaa-Pro dipeptidase
MTLKRRDFIKLSAGSTAGAAFLAACNSPAETTAKSETPLDKLKPMTGDVKPITLQERESRLEKAQKLMTDNNIKALYLDGGTSMALLYGN